MGRNVEDPNELLAKQRAEREKRKRRRVGGGNTEKQLQEGKTQSRQNGEVVITEKRESREAGAQQQGRTEERESGTTEERQNGITEERDTEEAEELQHGNTGIPQNVVTGEQQNIAESEPIQAQTTVKREDDKILGLQEAMTVSPQSDKEETMRQGITVKNESEKAGTLQKMEAESQENVKTGEQQGGNVVVDEEKATEKITLYLSWRQLDKLDEMVRGYKRRKRKRTDQNKLMRMMIDKFTLDDILAD
jgi:hypothetical protein